MWRPVRSSALILDVEWLLNAVSTSDHDISTIPIVGIIVAVLLSVAITAYVRRKIMQRTKLEQAMDLKTHELGERVKELSLIYHFNNILQAEGQNEDEIFTKLVNILPAGWQYVDICEARISFEGKSYTTPGCVDSVYKQSENFILADGKKGLIEIVYTKEMPEAAEGPFLKEERDLINYIARSLEIALNKLAQQKALASSEERFRSSFEYAGIGMGITSLDGKWIRVNKSLCDMVGYSNEEMLSSTFQQITHPDDLERDLAFMLKSIKGEANFFHADKRYIHKNGQIIWIDVTASIVRDKKAEPQYFIAQIVNITESREMREALELALSLTRATIESTADGILVVDASGKISGYNQQFLKLWQIPEPIIKTNDDAKVLAYAINQLINPKEFESKVQELYSNPVDESWDVLHFSDGRIFERYSKPQVSRNEIVGRVWSFRDVTQQKRAEAEIKELNADLEKRVKERTSEVIELNDELKANLKTMELANKDLESFSYSVSHDLRAPLRGIKLFIEMLEHKNVSMDEESKRYLMKISKNADKMEQLIKDLLALSHTGKKELEKENIDMNALLQEVLYSINIHEWNDHTKVVTGDMLPTSGDRSLLNQVLYNLISNALKYSSSKEDPVIEIGSYTDENENVYFIKDNGAGFNMDYYDKLFKVFERMHSDKEFEGTGVGLAIVQRVIEKHKGRVWAEGEENVGATFYFALPTADPALQTQTESDG